MKTPENIKIKRRLVGLRRVPTLIEINNYKYPVPMYYVFRLDPITRDTKLLSLTVTDSWGHRVRYDIYSTLGLNTGSLKETSLVVLIQDLVSTNKSKVTYPKDTLSSKHKITLEYVRAGNNAITYKLLADDEFYAFVNLEYMGINQLGYKALGIDNSYADGTLKALAIIYTLLLKNYNGDKELIALCEQLGKYFTPTLYSKLRSEKLQWWYFMQTRIILTVGCVGKTYLDKTYSNVYDFDKHTLDYKYDRTGFEHLSNEEFKGLPNRKTNESWFKRYMEDWCKVIDSNQYDVVTGWLQQDCLNYLVNKGYPIEIVVVDVRDYESIYKERSQRRGKNEQYWTNLRGYYDKTLELHKERKDIKVTIFDKPYYLSEYLVFSGVILKQSTRLGDTYIHKVSEKIGAEFRTEYSSLSDIFVPFYTQLVLTALSLNVDITAEMVHDAWAVARYNKDDADIHKSMIPFSSLSKEVQDLDNPYVEKLNEVLNYFRGLRSLVEVSNAHK